MKKKENGRLIALVFVAIKVQLLESVYHCFNSAWKWFTGGLFFFFFFPSVTANMTATQLTESGKNQFLLLSLQIPNFRHTHIHFSSLKKILFKEVIGWDDMFADRELRSYTSHRKSPIFSKFPFQSIHESKSFSPTVSFSRV